MLWDTGERMSLVYGAGNVYEVRIVDDDSAAIVAAALKGLIFEYYL